MFIMLSTSQPMHDSLTLNVALSVKIFLFNFKNYEHMSGYSYQGITTSTRDVIHTGLW